jgi:uncharacterized membrane protein HdeD (DUF308 family)
MRIESLPLILGFVLGLFGVALMIDAWLPDRFQSERRLIAREERDRKGEVLVGLAAIAMAVTFIGRDTWRYSVLAVIAGAIVLIWGTRRNREYLRGALTRTTKRNDKKSHVDTGSRRIR